MSEQIKRKEENEQSKDMTFVLTLLRDEFQGKVNALDKEINSIKDDIRDIKNEQREIHSEIQRTRDTIVNRQQDNLRSIVRWQAGILGTILATIIGGILQVGFHLFFH